MNKTDVIRMAQEAGATIRQGHRMGVIVYEDGGNLSPMVLERFAALVAAAERERCANKCDAISDDFSKRYGDFNGEELGADTCAEVIRALSDEVIMDDERRGMLIDGTAERIAEAAYQQGARDMQERCAMIAIAARDGYAERNNLMACASDYIACAIRALKDCEE